MGLFPPVLVYGRSTALRRFVFGRDDEDDEDDDVDAIVFPSVDVVG